VSGCKCKSLISTMTEFLNLCQDGTDTSVCLGIMLKNNNVAVESVSYI
jgi:hypothetical protein